MSYKDSRKIGRHKFSIIPRRLPNVPNEETACALLAGTTKERDRLILLLIRFAGLRVSEVCKLRIEHLDFRSCFLWVREGKGKRDRCIPLLKKLANPLKGWIGHRREGYVFPAPNGIKQLSVRTIQVMIKRCASKAGLPGALEPRRYHPHCLRHFFATSLLRTGADIMEVKELLGHSQLSTTLVYLHVDPARLVGAVNRLWE